MAGAGRPVSSETALAGAVTARRWEPADVRAEFARWQAAEPTRARVLDTEALAYVDYHSVRYARLLSTVAELATGAHPRDRLQILDIGPNVQTALLRAAHPGAVIDTLGFAHPAMVPNPPEQHIEFDLNDVPFLARRPPTEQRYDVVVLAEVVEHLYTSLSIVLGWVAEWLRPPGFVVVQTPNGAALHKRLRLLTGRSPVAPPRACRQNPGHFHEYTLAELRAEVAAAGLVLQSLQVDNHFGGTSAAARLYRGFGSVLPPSLRHGVTLCARTAG
ncbi:MAG: class I SAM-dependent methyltransferase [Actinomycetota bacterium]|nr:class I SAM-dependent methyltransferase [Actinomycetota bacterium]